MSWNRSLFLNITGGILVALLVANFILTLINNSQNATLVAMQQEIQKDRATVSQAQEVSTRVVRFLQTIAARLTQATNADPKLKDALTAADSTGIYAKLESMIQQAQAQAAAAAKASPTPASAATPQSTTP